MILKTIPTIGYIHFAHHTVVTGGRQDFDNTEQTITFPANPNTAERAVDITFFDDDINEALEVFYIVVRADNSTGDVPDSLSYVKNGIALAVIDDNDREHYIYTLYD